MPRVSQWISERFENFIEQAQGREQALNFDLLIVGSGYGGAIAAHTFAGRQHEGRPLRIGLLERGDEYLTGMFPKDFAELPGHVRGLAGASRFGQSHGLFDLRVNGDMNVLTGNGIGGGSLINAGIMAAPLPAVFDQRWPMALRDGAGLDFIRARALVGAASNDDSSIANSIGASGKVPNKYRSLEALSPENCTEAPVTTAMRDGPNQAGIEMSACNHCGDCVTGCNQGAKNSLDLNLLAQAKHKGVEIYAGVSVGKLEQDTQSEDGWLLHCHLTHDKLRQGQSGVIYLRAKQVILAAGSLGSTEILMRSATERLKFSEHLGQGFSGNGDAIAVGFKQNMLAQAIAWPESKPSDRQVGPTITGILDLRESAGVLIEEMAVPNALAQLFSELYTSSNGLNALTHWNNQDHTSGPVVDDPLSLNRHDLNHTSLYAIMGDDSADGQLELKSPKDRVFAEGELQVHWPSVKDKPLFSEQINRLKSLAEKSIKGSVLSNPAWSPLPAALSELYGAPKGPLLTVHPLGGCAMADTIDRGVVNHLGEVFNGDAVGGTHSGLVVLDGSIMPSALGINPALTISALALRASEHLCAQWGYVVDQIACLNLDPIATVRPRWRDTNVEAKQTPTKIEVNERLSGEISLATSTGQATFIAELTLKFKAKALTDFYTCAGNGSRQDRVSEVNGESDGDKPCSYLRLYQPTTWHQLTNSRANESAFEQAALLIAPISGQLEVMQRQPLSAKRRYWRGTVAWALNRGIRDILQSLRHSSATTSTLSLPEKAKNLLKLTGYAGEARLFLYELAVHKPATGWPTEFLAFDDNRDDYAIAGKKTITYNRRANPIRQLSDITLTQFPGLITRKKPAVLSFDNRNIARNNQPLISITQHQNLVQAFADLCSFYAYFARLMMTTHLLTFRLPDTPSTKQPQRFAGKIKGLPAPEMTELQVATLENGLPIYIRLTRYKNTTSNQPPLIMLHGYSASSTTWAHPAIPNCAASYFHKRNRDIWLVDLRTSCGFLSAMLPWHFEDVAFQDIPLAISHVLQTTGQSQCDIIAHCMGSAMLSMAILTSPQAGAAYFKERKQLPSAIRNLVLTQVGPKVSFSPMNMTRGYLLKNLRHLMGNLPFTFKPNDVPSTVESLFDRALQVLPYPEQEFSRENPTFSWKQIRWSATRRRIDALYGQAFALDNVSDRLLEHIDDIFGPLSMGTLSQTIHFALQEQITNFDGENVYAVPENFRSRWHCNTLSLHGAKSGLADVGTATLLEQAMTQAKGKYQNHIFPNYGHQDLLIGNGCKDVFEKIQQFFEENTATTVAPAKLDDLPKAQNSYPFSLPSLGPVLGPALNDHLPVMLGTHLSASRPDWVLFIEVDAAGKPLADFKQALNDKTLSQHFHLMATRAMRYQWLKLTLEGRASGQREGIWQSYFIHDHQSTTQALPLSAPHPNNLMDLLTEQHSPYQALTAQHLNNIFTDDGFQAAYHSALAQANTDRQCGQIHWRPSRDENFSFIVAACQFPATLTDQQPAFASYQRLAQRLTQAHPPQLMLLLGDQVYVDPTAGVLDAQSYHHRYIEPYQTWLAQPEVIQVLRQLPSYMMPDDHEIANDWDLSVGRQRNFVHAKPGRENYLRFQRHELFQPQRWHFQKSQQLTALPLWQTAEHGGIHFFCVDARTERSGRSALNAGAEIMSAEQYSALTDWLKSTPKAAAKVISTSSIFLPRRLRSTTGLGASALSDAWDGYSLQQRALLSFIAEQKISNLLFVSGDEHISCHAQIEIQHAEGTQLIHSIHSSGLYAPIPFVNTKPEEFAEDDQLTLTAGHTQMSVRINASFFPGDGFAELRFEQVDNQWQLHCDFNRSQGKIPLALSFTSPVPTRKRPEPAPN
ncbi:alkaline phosphatase D family protein [Simiduia curdlanivorans]|uniref:Cholesterol oxidase n=1 Tax=Simiduia curdlanivorans TaxID=1492769 RepID=A0ABV8V6F2_9GAMM|nr:alpha/beta fold hydrolase [Simiduia curdlanivorans]MDN3638648.1 alkaline phosphatase D family protein [Simiduia curdlanivorans]